ncbi:MAG: hypothetical protein K8U03_18790 [Planctomycetia bacterium]|nr:hypothetical protein [Planctomycetia bacterium]
MPRFVILRHECPVESRRPSHWDFMLEHGEVLRTWALDLAPDIRELQVVALLPDHRLEYLAYEGPISGGRGTVAQWDAGTYEVIGHQGEPESLDGRDVTGDTLEILVAGRRLQGRVRLQHRRDIESIEPTFDYRFLPAAEIDI